MGVLKCIATTESEKFSKDPFLGNKFAKWSRIHSCSSRFVFIRGLFSQPHLLCHPARGVKYKEVFLHLVAGERVGTAEASSWVPLWFSLERELVFVSDPWGEKQAFLMHCPHPSLPKPHSASATNSKSSLEKTRDVSGQLLHCSFWSGHGTVIPCHSPYPTNTSRVVLKTFTEISK